jgi:UDP-N-acetylmuramoylalanine-D-glutamate ligase
MGDSMIETIGVIGAGQMGSGIAHVCALSGFTVVLTDLSAEALGKARAAIEASLSRQVARGRIREEDKAVTTVFVPIANAHHRLIVIAASNVNANVNIEVKRFSRSKRYTMVLDGQAPDAVHIVLAHAIGQLLQAVVYRVWKIVSSRLVTTKCAVVLNTLRRHRKSAFDALVC